MPCLANCSPVVAVIDSGTSLRRSVRFCAVTVTSSSASSATAAELIHVLALSVAASKRSFRGFIFTPFSCESTGAGHQVAVGFAQLTLEDLAARIFGQAV